MDFLYQLAQRVHRSAHRCCGTSRNVSGKVAWVVPNVAGSMCLLPVRCTVRAGYAALYVAPFLTLFLGGTVFSETASRTLPHGSARVAAVLAVAFGWRRASSCCAHGTSRPTGSGVTCDKPIDAPLSEVDDPGVLLKLRIAPTGTLVSQAVALAGSLDCWPRVWPSKFCSMLSVSRRFVGEDRFCG